MKINQFNQSGPEAGSRRQRSEEAPKRLALVKHRYPLCLGVGVWVWIGGPVAVIAARECQPGQRMCCDNWASLSRRAPAQRLWSHQPQLR